MTKTWFDGENIITQEIPEAELYKRPWVGLTDKEIKATAEIQGMNDRITFARAIEARLKERNT